ncbi:MAG TPA: ATP-binding protein [Allosphingosinicella sp.]|nr:ATP-binding protein [Allosphingosinicella sp.]
MSERRALVHGAAAVIFVLATALAIYAQQSGRPITAAIVYLLGVTLVGALGGLRGGLAAALLASLTYNFFISDPVFTFSLSSAEEYVPLIAFNVCAAASALLAGRLKDRALAAEFATRRMQALFHVSQKLQGAVHLRDIPDAIADFLGVWGAAEPEIYVSAGLDVAPIQPSSRHERLAKLAMSESAGTWRQDDIRAFVLATPKGPIGVLILVLEAGAGSGPREHDLDAFVNLLSITLERCLLLEQVAEAELVKRSEEFKTALLSSVSHDMRTPLSAISASASSLASYGAELPDEVRTDLLTMIQEQCDRLNRYTTNLLNLGRLQAGVDPERFTECDALDVLGTAISRARSIADGQEIKKSYAAPEAVVRADPVMLEQIFYNVLENAVRYSPPGSPIRVLARLEGARLAVEIADEGPGISPSEAERVFERFYRSHAALGQDGSGLGLSIAKGFTEAFGGTIAAAPAEDLVGGTVVKIILPLQPELGHP